MIGRLAAWFCRGVRTPAPAEAVDQEDEDAWLRMAATLTPHERLAAGKAQHRRGLRP